MFNLDSLLERFKHLRNPKIDKINILNILNDELGSSINESEIEISKGELRIHSSSLVRTKVFLKKEILLQKIKDSFPELEIKKIL